MGKTLTAVEWECVEKNIMSGIGATLLVDGFEVTYKLVQLKGKLAFGIAPRFEVELLKKWFAEDCPERRLFFRPVTTSAWTPKSRQQMAKVSKSRLKRLGIDPEKKITQYFPWWTQFNALKRHLNKHASSIELVEG